MNKKNQIIQLNQLYNEYKILIDEVATKTNESSSKDNIALQFKQKFLNKFDEFEPTDTIKLLYEYFWNILSEEKEKKIFFDYNLLMFEIIAAKLVRKPKILDVWFEANNENKRKFVKLLNQAENELLVCSKIKENLDFKEILENLINSKPNLLIKYLIFVNYRKEMNNFENIYLM